MLLLDRPTINMLHILFVAPLLLYIGYVGFMGQVIPTQAFQFIMVLGGFVGAYHLMLYNQNVSENMVVIEEEIKQKYNY